MAEESGIIVIKGPEDLLKYFLVAKSSNSSDLLHKLAEITGIEACELDHEAYLFHSAVIRSGYLKIEYSGPEWSYLVKLIVNAGKGIQIYSRSNNEYGLYGFFALTSKGKKFVYTIDSDNDNLEEQEGSEEAIDNVNQWLSLIPKKVNSAFPVLTDVDLGSIVPALSLEQGEAKINLKCKFDASVTMQEISDALRGEYNDFTLTTYKDSEHAGGSYCGYWDSIRIKTMELKPDDFETYKVAFWFPISDGKKTAKQLLELLLNAGLKPEYAIEFFGEQSTPYIIHYIDNTNIKTIFESKDYTDNELEALSDNKDNDIDIKINWYNLEFEQIKYLHQKFGIKQYADKKLRDTAN